MTTETFFGTLTTALGLAMIVIGFPALIRKNKRERKCGVPFSMAAIGFATCAVRLVYAWKINSVFIMIPDAFGVLVSGIVLAQWCKYRTRPELPP